MADGTRSLTLPQEIALLVALRWRILRNQLRQKNAKLEALGFVLTSLFFAVFVFLIAWGFEAGAAALVRSGPIHYLALLFWAVLLFWQMFSLFFSSLTTRFDFRSLLRFPLHLRSYFVMYIGYGAADPVAITAIVWLLAIVVGVSSARPALFPAASLVIFVFALLNILLERCIGSWLEKLLSKRRTREILFALMILCMVGVQFSVPWIEGRGKAILPWLQRFLPFLNALPPGLAGRALVAAGAGRLLAFAGALAGLTACAASFGYLLWRRLAAQYRGELLAESEGGARIPATMKSSEVEPESRLLQLLAPEVAAVIEKDLRYLFRNTITVVNLLLPLLFTFLFTMPVDVARHARGFPAPRGDWLLLSAVGYVLLFLLAPTYNAFAYEGRGMQTYFMAPVEFRSILLGKNLISLMLIAVEVAAVIVLLELRGIVPGVQQLALTLAAAAYVIPAQFTIANWTSVAFPRKLEFGSMRNNRASGVTMLITLGTYITLGFSAFAVTLAGRWFGNPWVSTGVFLLLAAAATSGYVASLDALSSLAEKKREVLLDALCR